MHVLRFLDVHVINNDNLSSLVYLSTEFSKVFFSYLGCFVTFCPALYRVLVDVGVEVEYLSVGACQLLGDSGLAAAW